MLNHWQTRSILDDLDQVMTAGIERGVFPGGVILVRHRDAIVVHAAYGHSRTHADFHTTLKSPNATRPETIHDLASITKLFTATVVMQLVDENTFGLDDTVASHLPEFAVGGKAGITIRQLLTHTSGLPYVRLWEHAASRDTLIRRIMSVAPTSIPGTTCTYHDTNYIVLGRLVEHVAGKRLDEILEARIFDPLGLGDSKFGPLDLDLVDVAATEDESHLGREMVHGVAHDENAWALEGVSGHAGLFGSARDLSIFGQMFLNRGQYRGTMVLQPETVSAMIRNQVGDLGNRGLGWQVNAPHSMGALASAETFGHTGFTGTSIVVDPRRQLVIVLLTNRVHPTRLGPDIGPVRRAIAELVMGAADAA